MGELHDRMVRDMEVRQFSERAVGAYVGGVKGLAKYYRRRPDWSCHEVGTMLPGPRFARRSPPPCCARVVSGASRATCPSVP
jgi:hypothetical protein